MHSFSSINLNWFQMAV